MIQCVSVVMGSYFLRGRARVGDTGRMQPVRKVLTEWEATEQSLGCNGLLILCVDRINQSTTRVKKMVGQARIHTKIL